MIRCFHKCHCSCHRGEDVFHISNCCSAKCSVCGEYVVMLQDHTNKCHSSKDKDPSK